MNQNFIDDLEQFLIDCEEYFDNGADADWQGDPGDYVPNDKMRFLGRVYDLQKQLKSIQKKQTETKTF